MADNNASNKQARDKEIVDQERKNLEEQGKLIEKYREEYKAAQEEDLNAEARAIDENETKLIEENLENLLLGEQVEGLKHTLNLAPQAFIDKVFLAALNSKESDKNLGILLLAISNKEISPGAIGLTSRKLLIEHYKEETEILKVFYRAMFVTPISGRLLIESIGENAKTLKPLLELISDDHDQEFLPQFQKLTGTSTALFVRIFGLELLKKLLTKSQEAELLEQDINKKDTTEIAKKVRANLQEDGKNINGYSTSAIIAILKFIKKDKDKTLHEKAIKGLSEDNKKLVAVVLNLRVKEREATERRMNPTPVDETDKLEEKKNEKTKEKIEDEKFDVEIGKTRTKFNIDGVERSFLTKNYIKKELDKLKTPAEKKLYCYKKLLDIIDRDGSMHKTIGGKKNPNYNKHNVAGRDHEKFEKSNTKLKEDIARLEGIVGGKTTVTRAKTKAKASEVVGGEEKQTAAPKAEDVAPAEAAPKAEGVEQAAPASAAPASAAPKAQEATPTEAAPAPTAPISEGRKANEVDSNGNKVETESKVNLNAQVEDIDGAMTELQLLGLTMKKPEKLTTRQFNALKTFATSMKSEMDNADDAVSLLYKLKDISNTLKKALETSEIKEVNFKYQTHTLLWEKAMSFGFGDESDFLDKLLSIKKTQFAKQPKQYIQFYERSRTKFVELEDRAETSMDQTKYFKDYDKYVNESFAVNEAVGALSEEEMVAQWPNMDGFKDVEITLTSPPFSQFREAAPKKVAQIISEWSNKNIEFSHIFKATDMFQGLNEKILPKKFVASADAFKDEIARLQANVSKLSNDEKTRLSYMFHYIYYPCIKLLEQIKKLKPIKKSTTEEEEEVPREDNVQVLQGLEKFFTHSERSAGIWEKFITTLSKNGASSVTMSDIDGKTFVVDGGRLQRKYSPLAALKALVKRPEMFTISETDEKVLNDKALTKEVNRLMELGLINVNIRNKTNRKIDTLKITSLKNGTFTPLQMSLFQIGFLIDQASRFTSQIEKGLEAEKTTSPTTEKILNDLVKQGVSQTHIPAIRKQMLLVAGAQFEDGRFKSALLGVPIKINNKISIKLGLGANTKGQVLAGIGASVEVYENGSFKARAVAEVDVKGFTVGSSQSMELGMVQLSAFEGVRWSWTSLLPTVGGGIMLAWNTDKQLKKDIASKEEESGLKGAFEAWKKIPKGQVEKRYQALKSIKKIWDRVAPMQALYKLTNADIVHIVENIQEDITDEALEDLSSSPIPLIASIGIGLVGGIPMPIVGIKLGSAKVSVPQRREIAKILATLSNAKVEKDLRDALAKFDGKTEKMTVYKEVTGDVVYSKEGLLMIKDEKNSTELDFSSWKTDSLEGANDSLRKANMRIVLRQLPNNRIELKILDTDNQDTELYPDPLLDTLAIAKDGSKLIIEGNIKDLVISRERFTLPFKGSTNVASIREKITIRQSTSVAGKRDSSWSEKHNKGFFQKLEAEGEYHLYNKDKKGKNISDKYEDIAKFKKDRPNLKGKIGTNEAAAYSALISDRDEALKTLTAKDYSKQSVRPDLFTGLDSFYADVMKTEKDPVGLYASLSRRMDRPKEIIKFLKENTKNHTGLKNLNDKESNLALVHILNKWFTTLYKNAKNSPSARTKLKRSLKARIKYFKDEVFAPAIEKARFRINARRKEGQMEGIKTSAEDLTNQLIDQIYGKLLKQIDTKGFDFAKLAVTPITEGATMISGSRFYREGSRDPMLAETVNYSTLSKDKALKHAFGFLEITRNPQNLNSKNELARVMLEMASPLPIEDEKFLRSPFTLKLLSLKALVLVQGNRDFKLMTEVIKNRTLLQNFDGPHKQALERFKDLAEDIRNAQIEGKTLKYVIKDTGLTVTLDMNANIESGAYAKCGNATFTAEEKGTVTVTREATGEVVGVFKQTDEVIDAKLDKIFKSIAITGINTKKLQRKTETQPKPKPQPQPKPKGGKVAAEGGGANPNQTTPAAANPMKMNSNGDISGVNNKGGAAGVSQGTPDVEQSQTF